MIALYCLAAALVSALFLFIIVEIIVGLAAVRMAGICSSREKG